MKQQSTLIVMHIYLIYDKNQSKSYGVNLNKYFSVTFDHITPKKEAGLNSMHEKIFFSLVICMDILKLSGLKCQSKGSARQKNHD